jgi:eukaryotic-like serine/threonine-protein kinase
LARLSIAAPRERLRCGDELFSRRWPEIATLYRVLLDHWPSHGARVGATVAFIECGELHAAADQLAQIPPERAQRYPAWWAARAGRDRRCPLAFAKVYRSRDSPTRKETTAIASSLPQLTIDDSAASHGVIYRFGAFELDELAHELRHFGAPCPLPSKPFALLHLLLSRAGETLSKGEILEQVWNGRAVTEGVLNQVVMRLRESLDDGDQTLIRTVHGIGLRFVGAVERIQAEHGISVARIDAGTRIPQRPQWILERSLNAGGRAPVWLAQRQKSGERRVYKFATTSDALAGLQREITVARVLKQSQRPAAFLLPLDWNSESPPFFVEYPYCAGGDLADWIDAQADAPRALRLEIAAQIAESLSVAHSMGVIHGDIKPRNVLFDAADATALRLCDFGSGRISEPERLRALQITAAGIDAVNELAPTGGTLLYLAPERLAGQPAQVQSDVYAFGVVLFQLLLGDFRRALAPGWERALDDDLLSGEIAALCDADSMRRDINLGACAERLRQLDARRAERDAARERERAAAFTMKRLAHARRQRRGAWALSAVFAIGAALSAAMYFRAESALRAEQAQKNLADAVQSFLFNQILNASTGSDARNPNLRLSAVLDLAAQRGAIDFARFPEQKLSLMLSLGRSNLVLGRYREADHELNVANALLADVAATPCLRAELALARYEVAIALRPGELGPRPPLEPEALIQACPEPQLPLRLAELNAQYFGALGRYHESVEVIETALAPAESSPSERTMELKILLVGYLASNNESERAAKLLRSIDEAPLSAPLAQRLEVVRARVLYGEGDYVGALTAQQRARDIAAEWWGERHPATLLADVDLGSMHFQGQRPELAFETMQNACATLTAEYGAAFHATRLCRRNFAHALAQAGRNDEALKAFTALLRLDERDPWPNRSLSVASMQVTAVLLRRMERYAEARQWIARALEIAESQLIDPEPHYLLYTTLARIDLAERRCDDARSHWREGQRRVLVLNGNQQSVATRFRLNMIETIRQEVEARCASPP